MWMHYQNEIRRMYEKRRPFLLLLIDTHNKPLRLPGSQQVAAGDLHQPFILSSKFQDHSSFSPGSPVTEDVNHFHDIRKANRLRQM